MTVLPLLGLAQARIEVESNGNEVVYLSVDFELTNNTNFGAVLNPEDDVDKNQLENTFTITNNGDEDLVISAINLLDVRNDFDITTNAVGTIAPGGSKNLVINFNSHKFGVAFAQVIIQSNDSRGEFRFYIKAKNILCEDGFSCNAISSEDPNVCSGAGDCIAEDTCECVDFRTGSNCQIPLVWSSGDKFASASFDFTPRIFIGPEISDPNNVYVFRVRINALDNFAGSLGVSLGLLNVQPPDMVHNIGRFAGEYGFLSSGDIYSAGSIGVYGKFYTQGDIVTVIYDAVNDRISYQLAKQGSTNNISQGLAFPRTETVAGRKLHFGLSVTCFGACEFEIIPQNFKP